MKQKLIVLLLSCVCFLSMMGQGVVTRQSKPKTTQPAAATKPKTTAATKSKTTTTTTPKTTSNQAKNTQPKQVANNATTSKVEAKEEQKPRYRVLNETEKTCEIYGKYGEPCMRPPSVNFRIPATIDGYTVVSIGDYAFTECLVYNVEIPVGINQIGERAFNDCRELQTVTLPNTITSIGEEAFRGCNKLASVSIPTSVKEIGQEAFQDCFKITEITIPSSTISIGKAPFFGCYSLKTIIVEKGNKVYDSRNNCNAIIKTSTNELIQGCDATIMPQDIRSIGYGAFARCKQFTDLSFSNTLKSIGGHAFFDCGNLKSIKIPSSVESIGNNDNPFYGCERLESIIVDKNNRVFDSRNNCNAIIKTATDELVTGSNSTIIPQNIKRIGHGAFYGCKKLMSDTQIPQTVTYIGGSAFMDCYYISSIIVPKGVEEIESYTFGWCRRLISITLPNTLKKLDNYAFSGCSNLRKVVSEMKQPLAIDQKTFEDISKDAILYIPVGTKSAYESAGWTKCFNQIIEQ